MFRWNMILLIVFTIALIMFKFHYVQMELELTPKREFMKKLFKFHYVQMEHFAKFLVICQNLFKFHYVQMELFLPFPYPPPLFHSLNSTMFRWNNDKIIFKFFIDCCLNSTMFRWNPSPVLSKTIVKFAFKFHYVQMELI